MLYLLFLTLGILAVFAEVAMLYAWVSARLRNKKEKIPTYNPNTCVIVPCKGVEKNFKENVKAITNQDYKDYTVLFVTDTKEGPAYKVLKKMFNKSSKVSIVDSEFIEGCSGKISALINGIKKSGDVEVYVFADSDILPHKKWLSILVSHLDNDEVGATTGYRWFFPFNLQSLFISSWNMALSFSLFYDSLNYAWGGSTAIKKKLFDDLNIEEEWKKGFSDDLILTNTVKKAGYKIKFLPECVSESPVDASIWNFIKWGTRQLIWVRWYYTSTLVWMLSVIGAVALKIATILGFVLLVTGYIIPGLLMISTIFFEIISGWIAHSTFRKNMEYPKDRFGSSFPYALMMPIVFFVAAYNNLASLFITEIKWGGRVYKKPSK